jgi:hypothetical protein
MSPKNDQTISALGGLLGALLGGTPQVQNHMDKTGQSLDQVLGSISGTGAPSGGQASSMGDALGSVLGGGASSNAPAQGAGGDALGSILGSLLGGGGASSAPAQGAGGDALGSILGSLLGGGGGSSAPAQGAGGDPLGSILGGLLGGETPSSPPTRAKSSSRASSSKSTKSAPPSGADPIGSILGGLLGVDTGGGASAIAGNPIANVFVKPIADALAKKTGMQPGLAQVVVVFALTTLLSAGTAKATKSFKPTDLVNRLATDGTVSQKYLKDSGLVAQLAQQSGLDQATAAQGLQQAFMALGTHVGDKSIQDQQAELQTLLGNWK